MMTSKTRQAVDERVWVKRMTPTARDIRKASKIRCAQEIAFNLHCSEAWNVDNEWIVDEAQAEALRIADRIITGWEKYPRSSFADVLAKVVAERQAGKG
jgi:hypothetical protein